MRKHVATILGFVISPLFAVMALAAIGIARNGIARHGLDLLAIWDDFGLVLIFYCYTLGVTLIIGLPAYLLLRHFNQVTWWSAMLGGMFTGAVPWFTSNVFDPSVIVIGGLSGFLFWLIWRQGQLKIPASN